MRDKPAFIVEEYEKERWAACESGESRDRLTTPSCETSRYTSGPAIPPRSDDPGLS